MLKAVLAVVLAANLLFFGFTRGWFDGAFGLNSRGDREPERVARQVRAAAIVLMPMASAASGSASSSSCWEAGPVAVAEANAAEAALKAALPAGSWVDLRGDGSSATASHTYRVTEASAELVAKLATLRLGAAGRTFSACARS